VFHTSQYQYHVCLFWIFTPLRGIRRSVPRTCLTVVSCLVLPRVDYCNVCTVGWPCTCGVCNRWWTQLHGYVFVSSNYDHRSYTPITLAENSIWRIDYKLAVLVFTARCDAWARSLLSRSVCLSICPSVRPSVRPSRSWITSKRINISSKFFHHRVATPF